MSKAATDAEVIEALIAQSNRWYKRYEKAVYALTLMKQERDEARRELAELRGSSTLPVLRIKEKR